MICDIFSLTFPIDWEEIGAIASAAAVIIALYSNHKTTKEMKTTLQMQEQSKNLELMEERLKIAECIQNDEAISELKFKILFNTEIYSAYEHYKKWEQQYQSAQSDEKIFFSYCENQDGEGGYNNEVREKIEQYEILMNEPDCPSKIIDEYKKYCHDNAVCCSDTGKPEDYKWYNHAEISERISNSYRMLSEAKNSLLQQMEQFIKDSIKEVK